MEVSEINEIAQVVDALRSRLRVASFMASEQPSISKENMQIARDMCGNVLKRIEKFIEEN